MEDEAGQEDPNETGETGWNEASSSGYPNGYSGQFNNREARIFPVRSDSYGYNQSTGHQAGDADSTAFSQTQEMPQADKQSSEFAFQQMYPLDPQYPIQYPAFCLTSPARDTSGERYHTSTFQTFSPGLNGSLSQPPGQGSSPRQDWDLPGMMDSDVQYPSINAFTQSDNAQLHHMSGHPQSGSMPRTTAGSPIRLPGSFPLAEDTPHGSYSCIPMRPGMLESGMFNSRIPSHNANAQLAQDTQPSSVRRNASVANQSDQHLLSSARSHPHQVHGASRTWSLTTQTSPGDHQIRIPGVSETQQYHRDRHSPLPLVTSLPRQRDSYILGGNQRPNFKPDITRLSVPDQSTEGLRPHSGRRRRRVTSETYAQLLQSTPTVGHRRKRKLDGTSDNSNTKQQSPRKGRKLKKLTQREKEVRAWKRKKGVCPDCRHRKVNCTHINVVASTEGTPSRTSSSGVGPMTASDEPYLDQDHEVLTSRASQTLVATELQAPSLGSPRSPPVEARIRPQGQLRRGIGEQFPPTSQFTQPLCSRTRGVRPQRLPSRETQGREPQNRR